MNEIMVLLKCAHTRRFNIKVVPEVGDIIHCRFDGEQPIIIVYPFEWHVRCTMCAYSRWAGQDEKQGKRQMAYHTRAKTHKVTLTYDKVGEKKVKAAQTSFDIATQYATIKATDLDSPAPF